MFSPAPENKVSREVGSNQGNGQAQFCFGSWMKNKRVNSNVPQRKQCQRRFSKLRGWGLSLGESEVMKPRHGLILQ